MQRLIQAEAALWGFCNDTLNDLLDDVIGVIPEALAPYGDDIPFGISLAEMTDYALDQFNKRYTVLERAVDVAAA